MTGASAGARGRRAVALALAASVGLAICAGIVAPPAAARVRPAPCGTCPAPLDTLALRAELERAEAELLALRARISGLSLSPDDGRRVRLRPRWTRRGAGYDIIARPGDLERLLSAPDESLWTLDAPGGVPPEGPATFAPAPPLPNMWLGHVLHDPRWRPRRSNEGRDHGEVAGAGAPLARARRRQAFRLRHGQAIALTHEYGDVVVEPADGDDAEFVQWVAVPDGAEAHAALERALASIAVDAKERGDSLVLAVVRPRGPVPPVSLDVTLRVPPGHPVSVTAAYGDILVRDLSATLSASASFGDVDVLRTSGPLVVRSRYGDVVIRRHDGPVTIDHAVGNVGVQGVDGAVDLATRFGEATLADVLGSCSAQVRGANVTISEIRGSLRVRGDRSRIAVRGVEGPLDVASDLGDVRLDDLRDGGVVEARRGRLDVGTSSGTLRVTGRDATIRTHDTSGSVDIDNTGGDVVVDTRGAGLLHRLNARTSGGAVVVYLPNDLSADVEATALHGDVRSDVPLVVTRQRDVVHAAGRVGRGGATYLVRSDGGGVLLCTADGLRRVRRAPERPVLRPAGAPRP